MARPWTGHPLQNPDSLLYSKVIHFDFDRSEIKPEYRDTVIAHGKYLAENPSARVTIEGHCDERGSREYNIGLGERRANTVKQLLLAQGAMQSQITTVSYGEEQPVAFGSDEASWAQNRRAVFAY
jgi:peptidoglycan-associated lipoprotein